MKDAQQDKENNLESWTDTSLSSRVAQNLAYRKGIRDENKLKNESNSNLDWEIILQSTKSLSISDSQSKSVEKKETVTRNSTQYLQHLEEVSNSPPSFITPYCVRGLQNTEEVVVLRKFKKNREDLLKQLYNFYNERVFSKQLKETLVSTYNNQMERTVSIQISIKVVDRGERLLSTLAHEMCHAAQWIIDGVAKPPHGREFQRWSEEFKKTLPFVQVNVKHSYNIVYKYIYFCQSCGLQYGRHSKSIDTCRQRCGRCKGQLILKV
ncbi:HMG box-containing protein C19G7.04 [Galdieria sulphuraria]|nr:HMG box-containing protein C19G7.04 [Galdieria sulphuraria]